MLSFVLFACINSPYCSSIALEPVFVLDSGDAERVNENTGEVRAKSVSHVKKVCSSSFSLHFSSASSFISFSDFTSTNHSDSLKQTINNRLIPRKQ